jgi:hypothetical protein
LKHESKNINEQLEKVLPVMQVHQQTMDRVRDIIDLMNAFPVQTADMWKDYIRQEAENVQTWNQDLDRYYDQYLEHRAQTVRELELRIQDMIRGLMLYVAQAFNELDKTHLLLIQELSKQSGEHRRLYDESRAMIYDRHVTISQHLPDVSNEIRTLTQGFKAVVEHADQTHMAEYQSQMQNVLQTIVKKLKNMTDTIIRNPELHSYLQTLDEICVQFHAQGSAPFYSLMTTSSSANANNTAYDPSKSSAHVTREHERLEPDTLLSGSEFEKILAEQHRQQHHYRDDTEAVRLAKQKQGDALHKWNLVQQQNNRVMNPIAENTQ